ncbi:MAG: hypothetical protein GX465_14105, partial [Acidobacteria bacterium]|nr:hypothetical protein [Acidobacteriota bacterium]
MARYRLLITLAIVSLAFATYGDQPVFAPRDPSAARKDFSNVDPSTAIDALNLGTMATEASADYVATGTFTGHTDATAAHGAAEVADAADIPNNASFTLAGLGSKAFSDLSDKPTTLSGYGITDALGNPMIADLEYNSDSWGIHHAASDTAYMYVSAGSAAGSAYGAYIEMMGNQHDTYAGQMVFHAGNVASGTITFYTEDLAMEIKRDGVVNFPAT